MCGLTCERLVTGLRFHTLADDGFAVFPVQVGSLDHVVLGVHPVHAMAGVVDGESVRPEQVGVGDDPASRAVHVCVLDPRGVTPVRPVNLPEGSERKLYSLAHRQSV